MVRPEPGCSCLPEGGVVTSTYPPIPNFNWQRDMLPDGTILRFAAIFSCIFKHLVR